MNFNEIHSLICPKSHLIVIKHHPIISMVLPVQTFQILGLNPWVTFMDFDDLHNLICTKYFPMVIKHHWTKCTKDIDVIRYFSWYCRFSNILFYDIIGVGRLVGIIRAALFCFLFLVPWVVKKGKSVNPGDVLTTLFDRGGLVRGEKYVNKTPLQG